jgi:hypothetical protein
MNTMKTVVVSIVIVFLLLLVAGLPLFAAPIPPLLVVNHETKECATIMGGDECMDCFPPEGWETLGFAHEYECPLGYTQLDGIDARCEHFKDEFCCSEGHSGVHGDCEDMVLDDERKLCAFVDDIHTAVLPVGWDRMPKDLVFYEWACPSHYAWVD